MLISRKTPQPSAKWGTILDSSEQRGPGGDDNQLRSAVRAGAHNPLADAANLAAIGEQRALDGDMSSDEIALAMRSAAGLTR